jgi:ribonuclease T2
MSPRALPIIPSQRNPPSSDELDASSWSLEANGILPTMKHAALTFTLALMVAATGCKSPTTASATKSPSSAQHTTLPTGSGFDYYLLNLSWSPEFCYSHPNAPECGSHSTFVLHGLWPQNYDGTYPENCSAAPGPSDPAAYKDIYPDQGLLEHEWRTHGTCSGLSADAFLSTARAAYQSVTVPAKLRNLTRQTSMSPNQIMNLFMEDNPRIPRESLAVSCGNNYLTAVEICLDKSLKPVQCGPLRSCRAITIRVPPPR